MCVRSVCVCVLHLEVRDAVALPQGDLEHLQVGDAGSQAGQRLLPTAPHAHQQSVATGTLQDAVDSADMRHGVLKQHLHPTHTHKHTVNKPALFSQLVKMWG